MEQQIVRASPEKEGEEKRNEQAPHSREVILRAHDLIFTSEGIFPKYTSQWR